MTTDSRGVRARYQRRYKKQSRIFSRLESQPAISATNCRHEILLHRLTAPGTRVAILAVSASCPARRPVSTGAASAAIQPEGKAIPEFTLSGQGRVLADKYCSRSS